MIGGTQGAILATATLCVVLLGPRIFRSIREAISDMWQTHLAAQREEQEAEALKARRINEMNAKLDQILERLDR